MKHAFQVALLLSSALFLGELLQRFRERGVRAGESGASVLVAARGHLLPAARVGSGPDWLARGVLLQERTLLPEGRDGLQLVCLTESLELVGQVFLDVRDTPQDIARFERAVREAPSRSFLIVASSGRVVPESIEDRARLERAARVLGSAVDPFALSPTSWAILAARADDAWVKLAEAHSNTSGVVLAFTLQPDVSAYRDHAGESVHHHPPGARFLLLFEELNAAERVAEGVTYTTFMTVGGIQLRSLFAPTRPRSESRVAWEHVPLGVQPRLDLYVGLADGRGEGSTGVEYGVRIDGRTIAAREVLARSASGWTPWQVDLSEHAGETVALELVTRALGSRTESALWGEAILTDDVSAPVEGFDPRTVGRMRVPGD